MVAHRRFCQRQEGRREEHGFVVRVRDEQADAFVTQFLEGRGAGDVGGVEPEDGEEWENEGCGCEVWMHCFVIALLFLSSLRRDEKRPNASLSFRHGHRCRHRGKTQLVT